MKREEIKNYIESKFACYDDEGEFKGYYSDGSLYDELMLRIAEEATGRKYTTDDYDADERALLKEAEKIAQGLLSEYGISAKLYMKGNPLADTEYEYKI